MKKKLIISILSIITISFIIYSFSSTYSLSNIEESNNSKLKYKEQINNGIENEDNIYVKQYKSQETISNNQQIVTDNNYEEYIFDVNNKKDSSAIINDFSFDTKSEDIKENFDVVDLDCENKQVINVESDDNSDLIKEEITYPDTISQDDEQKEEQQEIDIINGWSYPISNFTVTSDYTGYAHTRVDGSGYHHGIDLGKNCGAPVYPVASGTVGTRAWISGGGNTLYIYHNVGGVQYTSVYMKLSGYGAGIAAGSKVTTDTIIGYVGNTGLSYGCHLHLGLANGWRTSGDFNKNAFDPRSIFPGLPKMESGIVVKGR